MYGKTGQLSRRRAEKHAYRDANHDVFGEEAETEQVMINEEDVPHY